MEFKKSIIISLVVHAVFIVLMPGIRFSNEKLNWVAVSVETFSDIKEQEPQWQPGKMDIPKTSKKMMESVAEELDFPIDDIEVGIPIESEIAEMPELAQVKDYDPIQKYEKSVPDRKEREGIIEGAGQDKALVISGPVARRKLIREIYPKYPVWAEEKGTEGEVKLKFWVSPEGIVSSVELEKTSGYPDLDSRGIAALRKYLFSPLGREEEQKNQWGTIVIKYTLK